MKISDQWLREWLHTDLETDELAERLTSLGLEVDGVQRLGDDLDRFEAAAAGRMAQQLAEDEGIRIPYIDLELSHHDMLVIEWIDGVRIDDVDALVSAGHNIDQITEIAATSFFNQVFSRVTANCQRSIGK